MPVIRDREGILQVMPGYYWATLPNDEWNEASKLNRNWHPPMLRVRKTTGRVNPDFPSIRETWGVVQVLRPMAMSHWPYSDAVAVHGFNQRPASKWGELATTLTAKQLRSASPYPDIWEQPDPSTIHEVVEVIEDLKEGANEAVEEMGKAAAAGALRGIAGLALVATAGVVIYAVVKMSTNRKGYDIG